MAPRHGAVAVAVPGLTAGPGVRLVPPRMGIILLNPSERHHWMRLEPPSGSPVSPGAESRAGGGTAAIPGAGSPPRPRPPACCCTGPRQSQHRSCARAEGAERRRWVRPPVLARCARGSEPRGARTGAGAEPGKLCRRAKPPVPRDRRGCGGRRWRCPRHPAPPGMVKALLPWSGLQQPAGASPPRYRDGRPEPVLRGCPRVVLAAELPWSPVLSCTQSRCSAPARSKDFCLEPAPRRGG